MYEYVRPRPVTHTVFRTEDMTDLPALARHEDYHISLHMQLIHFEVYKRT